MRRSSLTRMTAFTRGQGTLEYILVLAAILVAIIAVTLGALRPGVKATMEDSANAVTKATGKLEAGLNLD